MEVLTGGQTINFKKILPVFLMAGFLLGIVFANIFFKDYISNVGILNDYFLNKYQYMEVDHKSLFGYIMESRLKTAGIVWLFGLTMLGSPIIYLYGTWFGFSAGMLLSSATMKFGIKGIGICLVGMFPQYLIYIPAMFFLMFRAYKMAGSFFTGGKSITGADRMKSKTGLVAEYFLMLLIAIVFLSVGCFLESYVNPPLFQSVIGKL